MLRIGMGYDVHAFADGRSLVIGGVELARRFGISEALVGLTVVAFGTSLPELATSVAAVLKGECEIGVGNVLGSNVFNLGLVILWDVPILIAGPGVPARVVDRSVSPVDIAPTIAAWLGIDPPEQAAGIPLIEVLGP